MAPNKLIQSAILLPISKVYGGVTALRNFLFKSKVLQQREFDIPVIVVGNLQVGGTGKTPHTEYILNALADQYNIGMISRGYKRRTTGFVLATNTSLPDEIGDEPYQIYRKFGSKVRVAVCEDRCEGIDKLREIDPSINMIVLDDAFQHRYVKPTVSVVLTEFNRPFYMDKMLPLGRLRESPLSIERADMVIISKCPTEIKPIEHRLLIKDMELLPYQGFFLSRYTYGNLRPVFPDEVDYTPSMLSMSSDDSILAISGIANPKPFHNFLEGYDATVKTMVFGDHHKFNKRDYDNILRKLSELKGSNKYIITTEKDAVRLHNDPSFPPQLRSQVFYLPIRVEFDPNYSPNFTENLLKRLREAASPIGKR